MKEKYKREANRIIVSVVVAGCDEQAERQNRKRRNKKKKRKRERTPERDAFGREAQKI